MAPFVSFSLMSLGPLVAGAFRATVVELCVLAADVAAIGSTASRDMTTRRCPLCKQP